MIFSWGNFCSEPLTACTKPFHVTKMQLNRSKPHVVGNLSSSHPSGQPSLWCPLSCPCSQPSSAAAFPAQCRTEPHFLFLIFLLWVWLAFSFLYNAVDRKKIPSALLIIQPFPFLCLPSPGQPLRKLWILHYFFASVHPELPRADLLRIYCSLTGKFFFNSLGYSSLQ